MEITIPDKCPSCSEELTFINSQLFCKNEMCPAQIQKRVEHFTKTLGIKGFGEKTIEKLNISSLIEIFYLQEEDISDAVGNKVATKLIEEIEAAKYSDLSSILTSFSIPLIGKVASQKLAEKITTLDEITESVCKEAGLGEIATKNLLKWFNGEYQEIKTFLPFKLKPKLNNSTGKTICITGKLISYKTKSEAHEVLESFGFTPVDSVTKTLNYLVDESNSTSSKRKKAESYNVQIINNLEQFLEELN